MTPRAQGQSLLLPQMSAVQNSLHLGAVIRTGHRAWVFLIGFQCLVNLTNIPYVSKQKYSHGHGEATHSRAYNFSQVQGPHTHMQLLVPFSWACHLNPKICSRVGMSLDRVSGSHSAASVRASVRHRSIHAGEKQNICQ